MLLEVIFHAPQSQKRKIEKAKLTTIWQFTILAGTSPLMFQLFCMLRHVTKQVQYQPSQVDASL